jgi:hypothetical protein
VQADESGEVAQNELPPVAIKGVDDAERTRKRLK